MFSKTANFRDVTLYVIPGNLTVYLLIKLLSEASGINLLINLTASFNNLGLVIAFISFSTLVGFIQSGFIIRYVNKYIHGKKSITLRTVPVYALVGPQIVKKIRKDLRIGKEIVIEDTPEIFGLVDSYVDLRTTDGSVRYADRLVTYSLIYCTIPLPLALAVLYLFGKVGITSLWKIPLWLGLSGILVAFCFSQSYRFRVQWVNTIYKLFYGLPADSLKNPGVETG
jgi:hypothetical protein